MGVSFAMVRRAIFLTLAAAIAVAVVVFYDPGKPVPVIGPSPAWRLTFLEEFTNPVLDPAKWNKQDSFGIVRNEELQAYVPDSFQVSDGTLKICGKRQRAYYDGAEREFTSGILTTYQKFSQRYGRFEIRCKVPAGRGLWPAFWLLPEPLGWPPEIDVMEVLGHAPNEVHMTHHWLKFPEETDFNGKDWSGLDFSEDFHIFAVEWSPDFIRWQIDGVQHFQSDHHIPDLPMYLLVNLAIGGNWPGSPDATTPFPAFFEVDYIRVYQRVGDRL